MRLYSLILLCLIFAVCSCSLSTRPVMGDRTISPREAVRDIPQDEALVLEWGGVIVETLNKENSTEIQIIAYPLQDNGKPDLDAPPAGRFIAIQQGYLETADYRQGRRITLSGTLLGLRDGKVGEADYRFPLVNPNEMQLWPQEASAEPKSRWHFGIGVGSGGSRGSIGVGIGL